MTGIKRRVPIVIVVFLVFAWNQPAAWGQWIEQTFTLVPGWNAVYLEVDPWPAEPSELFAGRPISAIWTRGSPFRGQGAVSLPECNSDVGGQQSPGGSSACAPSADYWQVWLPPSDTNHISTNLHLIRGGRVYLLRVSQATTLILKGKSSSARTRWGQGFNLAGFHVGGDTVGFRQYLSGSTAFSTSSVFAISPRGDPVRIADLSTERILQGKGYWVECSRPTEYDGPLGIDNLTVRGLDFGRSLTEHSVRVENLLATARDVTLAYLPSATPPGSTNAVPTFAGDVPLSWLDYGGGTRADEVYLWHHLSSQTFPLQAGGAGRVASGSRRTIRLAVNRAGLPAALLDEHLQGRQYQGVLQVSTSDGLRRWVSVTCEVPEGLQFLVAGDGGVAALPPGLYHGQVRVAEVTWVTAGARRWQNDSPVEDPRFEDRRCFGGPRGSEECAPDRRRCYGTPEIERQDRVCDDDADCPAPGACVTVTDCPGGACHGYCVNAKTQCSINGDCGAGDACTIDSNSDNFRKAGGAFSFPILMHVANDGTVKLLSEVTIKRKNGAPRPPPGQCEPTALVTPECRSPNCDQLEPITGTEDEPLVPRISTAAFTFPCPSAADDNPNDSYYPQCDLSLSWGPETADPTLVGETTLPPDHQLNPYRHLYHPDHNCDQVGECYAITRGFNLRFESGPPPGYVTSQWGASEFGGIYTENLRGLHKKSIGLRGRFTIRRIADIGELNVLKDWCLPNGQE